MGAHSDRFLDYLLQVKRYSQRTVLSYRIDIEQFESFAAERFEIMDLLQVESLMVRTWFAELMDTGIARSTFNRKRSALRSLYKYLMSDGLIEKNPMDSLSAVKKDKRLPVYIEEDKLEELLKAENFGSGFSDLRDLMMLELLYGTGMRLSELINLKHSDMDEGRQLLTITGKGNKQRILPLLGKVVDVYGLYATEKRRKFGAGAGNWVFVTDKGEQLYPQFVYRRVKYYLGQITTRTRKSPHVLRHSFATHMLNRGADLNAIKELLGHAGLSATQVYTHNTIEQIKHIYKQAHPKA
jgi:integrase/recombinase XerC